MKRSPQTTPDPSSAEPPLTPSPKKKAKAGTSPGKAAGASPGGGGVWANEKYSRLAEMIFSTAYEHMDKAKAAEELGVTKAQLSNQLTPGRSNFRKKFLDWAKALI